MGSMIGFIWFFGLAMVGVLWVTESIDARRHSDPWIAPAVFSATCLVLSPLGLLL